MKNLGFEIKSKGSKISLVFDKKPVFWRRFLSQMIKDKVIFQINEAKKKMKREGDVEIYNVFNLWKFDEKAKRILKDYDLQMDLTLLFSGTFSIKKGELFSTYGHKHEKYFGEFYLVLKNSCFLILSDLESKETKILRLKENRCAFIHPKYIHRLTCGKKDSLILGIVPKGAGHDYNIVKGRGFPFHIFLEKTFKIRRNPKFKSHIFKFKRPKNMKCLKFLKNFKKMEEILKNPDKFNNFYI